MEEPLEYGSKIKAITLASFDDNYRIGSYATVTGWGLLRMKGTIADQLREVDVPVVSNSECGDLYTQRKVTDRMLCAGYVGEGGKDACYVSKPQAVFPINTQNVTDPSSARYLFRFQRTKAG